MGTVNMLDEAKRRLQRTKSPQQPPQQNKEDDDDNSKGKASSQASTPTVTGDGNVSPPSNARRESSREASSATMQAMGSNSGSVMGYSQQQQILLHRPQRLRIREDLTKSTSFDRVSHLLYCISANPHLLTWSTVVH